MVDTTWLSGRVDKQMSSKQFLEAKKHLQEYSRDEVESMAINWMFRAQELNKKINKIGEQK